MALVVPYEGERGLLEMLRQNMNGQTIYVRLYKNNPSLGNGTQLGNFTEADFDGYQQQPINSWGQPGTVNGISSVSAVPVHFAFNSNQPLNGQNPSIYGYYVTVNLGTGEILLWAENIFNPAKAMTQNGHVIDLTPKLNLD